MASNATLIEFDDTSNQIRSTCSNGGVWTAFAGDNRTLRYTDRSDCSLSFTFDGVGVAILGQRDTSRGIFSVSVDDGPRFWINANAPRWEDRWTMASIQGLEYKTHSLSLQAGPLSGFTTAVDTLVVAASGGFEGFGVATKEGEWTSPYPYDPAFIPSALLSSAPSQTNNTSLPPAEPKSGASSISSGAGVGIGIAAILGIELLGLLIWFLFKRKRKGSSVHSRTTKTSFTSFGHSPSVNTNVPMTQQGGLPESTGPLSWRHGQASPASATALEPPSTFSVRAPVGEV